MIAVSRFWSQRVSFSQPKQKYVILGVTGPPEWSRNQPQKNTIHT